MAIEINDKGILVAMFVLAPGTVGEDLQWTVYGRGVVGVGIGADGEAEVEIEEKLATIPPQDPDGEVTYLIQATCTGSAGYAVATAIANDAVDALKKISVQTYEGCDVLTGDPVVVPQAVFVEVYRIPLPFVGVSPV